MDNLQDKIEDIRRRIDLLRNRLARQAYNQEITPTTYQMQSTYLARLYERAALLLNRLPHAGGAVERASPITDTLLEINGGIGQLTAALPEALRQRTLLAQKYCQTLGAILRIIDRPPRLLWLIPWPWRTRRGLGKISASLAQSKLHWQKEALRFSAESGEVLRRSGLPVTARDNLRAMIKLLREIDSRSLDQYLAMCQAEAAQQAAPKEA